MPISTTFPATTTSTALANSSNELAFVLLIEGYNIAFTSSSDVSGLDAAWTAASEWSNVIGGLEVVGAIEHSALPFDSKVQMPGLTFVITDAADTITSTFEREANSSAIKTKLVALSSGSMDSSITYMLAESSTSFPSTGTVYIGTEEIPYTGNFGGGLFAGLTRGRRSLFGTSVDANHFGRPHIVNFDDAGFAPVVSNVPGTWIGRQVALYLCSKTDGTWTAGLQAAGSAECVWSGRIQSHENDGDGKITVECSSIMELLKGSLLAETFTANIAGRWLSATTSGHMKVFGKRRDSTTGAYTMLKSQVTDTLIPADGTYTHEDIASLINQQLQVWFNGTATYFAAEISFHFFLAGDGYYEWEWRDTLAGQFSQFRLELDPDLAAMVGYSVPASQISNAEDESRWIENPTGFALKIANPPPAVVTLPHPSEVDGTTIITVQDIATSARFVPQPSMPSGLGFNPAATGFLGIGNIVIAVAPGAATNEFLFYGFLSGPGSRFAQGLGLAVPAFVDGANANIHYTFDSLQQALKDATVNGRVPVRQVWIETGRTGDLLLRLAVSTGTAAYNHSDYDDHPRSMGLGLPWTMIDEYSWLEVLGMRPYVLYLDKPTSFLRLIESALAVGNLHLVWRRGKLTITSAGEEGSALVALTEGNKAAAVTAAGDRVVERTSTSRTKDNLVNRVTLKHNHNPTTDAWSTVTINATDSQVAYGARAAVIEAIGLYDNLSAVDGDVISTWRSAMASQALAYFSQPLVGAERSFDISLLPSLYPGCKVLLTDSGVTNPATGVAGVTSLKCWVVATSFDFRTCVGRVSLLFQPTTYGKVNLLGPSARVDETSIVGGTAITYHGSEDCTAPSGGNTTWRQQTNTLIGDMTVAVLNFITSAGIPSTPSGWTIAGVVAGSGVVIATYYRIATVDGFGATVTYGNTLITTLLYGGITSGCRTYRSSGTAWSVVGTTAGDATSDLSYDITSSPDLGALFVNDVILAATTTNGNSFTGFNGEAMTTGATLSAPTNRYTAQTGGTLGGVLSDYTVTGAGSGIITAYGFDYTFAACAGVSAFVRIRYGVGGYATSTKVLTVKAHEFSGSGDAADATWFPATSKVKIIELSPTTTASPTSWADTVASQTGNTITLTTGLAGWTGAGYYVIEFDDVLTVTATQRDATAFLADELTHTTGYAAADEYVYGGARTLSPAGSTDTIVYTGRYRKLADIADDTGEPLSVHKLHEIQDFLNTALSYHTANVVFQWVASTTTDYVQATGSAVVETDRSLLLGPIWMPLYGGQRVLRALAYGTSRATAGTGGPSVVRIVTSTGMPRGTSATFENSLAEPFTYPDGGWSYAYLTLNQDTVAYGYTSEVTFTPAIIPGDPPGCWLTVEGFQTGDSNTVCRIKGLWIFEDYL